MPRGPRVSADVVVWAKASDILCGHPHNHRHCCRPLILIWRALDCWAAICFMLFLVAVTRIPPYRLRGVKRGPPGEGGAGPYTTPLRGPTTLPGREKSGV